MVMFVVLVELSIVGIYNRMEHILSTFFSHIFYHINKLIYEITLLEEAYIKGKELKEQKLLIWNVSEVIRIYYKKKNEI